MFPSVCSRAILFTLLFSTLFSIANAVPMELSHQGRLLDATDQPLSGTYTIIYSIHDAPVGGTQLWLEDHVGVVVTDGLFSVVLGSTVPLSADVLAGSGGGGGGSVGRYLQLQISGQPPIMPRTQLLSSPYSVASSRVSGDVQTAPGELKVSAASDTKRIGIRVADSLAEASSIAIDEPGVQIALRITPDSTVYDQGQSSGDRVMVHAIHRGEDRISQTVTPTTSSVAIKTKGTGAEANKTAALAAIASSGQYSSLSCSIDDDSDGDPETSVTSGCDSSGASQVMEKKGLNAVNVRLARTISGSTGSLTALDALDMDSDDDGVMDMSVTSSCDATGVKHAIKTKGTGADANKTAACSAISSIPFTGALSRFECTVDDDGDGVPEGEISQLVTPTTSSAAINTKGTGADKNRIVMQTSIGGLIPGASAVLDADSDGDGVPEGEISQLVTPTTCGVAIKTKGTGADKNRTISNICDDSSAVQLLEVDEDGDGNADADLRIQIERHNNGRYLASSRMTGDSDDDGIADISVETIVDNDSASFRLNGLPPGVPVTETISMRVSPTAVHMAVGAATCDGTNWVNASDKNAKENFEDIDGEDLLDKIAELEITKWNYKGDDEAQHIGPTAQDFKRTFGVGADDKSISTIDPSGIALAAIKELSKQNRELKEQNAKLIKQMDDLAKKVEKLASGK